MKHACRRPSVALKQGFLLTLISLALYGQSFSQARGFGPEIRKTDDGISYVSTGVGKDSRQNLPSFPLKLIFATRNSRYLANIETEIAPAGGGNAIRIRSIGPWLLVDLPPGKYSVTARTAGGQEVTRSFEIARGRVTQVKLIWNLTDEDI